MTAPFTPTREQRFYADKARLLAALRNLAKRVTELADEIETQTITSGLRKAEAVEYRWLVATDAASHVWRDMDWRDEIDMWLGELRLDRQGFPLRDDGDTDWNAEREFVPYVWGGL